MSSAVRFLHTGDWQIGMKCQGLGNASERVREERLNSGRRVVQAAKDYGAEFMLIAGDIFEDNAVDRVLVQKVADILRDFGGPVYVIPGNHDPFVPGSAWEHPAWKSAVNVTVITEETPIQAPGCILYPCPVREKHSDRNPTAWIPAQGDQPGIRIGLAHGTIQGIPVDEPDYPIPRDAAQRAGLDYLALGHWHSYATYTRTDGAPCMAYCGTHETSKFGERDSGNVLIVDISTPGSPPSITPVHTGCLTWNKMDAAVRDAGDLVRLRQRLEEITDPGNMLVEVTITGILAAADCPELGHIEQLLESRFLYGQLDASTLRPSPEDESWLATLPAGIVREAALRLQAESERQDESAAVAARALMELYAIAQEAGK